MKYDFETISDRYEMGSRKWIDRSKTYPFIDKSAVPFSVADMEFKNACEITEGLKKKLDDIILGYTIPTDDFYDAIINWDKRRHDSEIKKDWIVAVPTVVDGFFAAVRSFSEKNDGVMIMRPVYGPFKSAIELNERKMVDVKLKFDGHNYSIDFEKYEKECQNPHNKMLIFCNPHNPAGILWEKEDLIKIIKIANENDVIVVVDEIWQDIIMPGYSHTSVLSLDRKLVEKVVVCQAATKTFNLAGTCCAYTIISDEKMMEDYKKSLEVMRSNTVNIFGIEATKIALNQCEDWLEEVIQVIDTNQKMVSRFFAEKYPKIICNELESTYVMWIDFRCLEMDNDKLSHVLAEKCGLVLTDGRNFGECDGFMRLNVAAPTSVIQQALEKLDDLLQEIYK